MPLFKRRAAAPPPSRPLMAYWLSSGPNCPPPGYTRLIDCPEIQGAIDMYASVIGAATIYLMENRKDGDHRLHNRLASKIDVDPYHLTTRQGFVAWIISTMMGDGDGNAFVFPRLDLDGHIMDLEPMPGAVMQPTEDRRDYTVLWRGKTYRSSWLLHFQLFPDPSVPWRGRGYRVTGQQLADTLAGANALQTNLTNPDYKPPMVVYANVESDVFSDEKRAEFRRKYLEDNDRGLPWILPRDVIEVDQLKPLSLADLAIKDTSELNRTAVATMFNMPPFLLGVGSFNRDQYNAWIKTSILPKCQVITQTLTRGLLDRDDWYFVMPEKRLYAYTPMEMVTMLLAMSDRGYVNGDEVRDAAMMDPRGLTELKVLENYIPADMSGLQTKLIQGGD